MARQYLSSEFATEKAACFINRRLFKKLQKLQLQSAAAAFFAVFFRLAAAGIRFFRRVGIGSRWGWAFAGVVIVGFLAELFFAFAFFGAFFMFFAHHFSPVRV
jgi:hypothetical protein